MQRQVTSPPSGQSFLRTWLPAPALRVARYVSHRLGRCRLWKEVLTDSLRDGLDYARWAHDGRSDVHPGKMEHSIAKMYHGIEKGLSLPAPRPGFGAEKIRALLRKLDHWNAKYPPTLLTLGALESLRSYRAFNAAHDITFPWLDAWLDRQSHTTVPAQGGTAPRNREEILSVTRGVGPDFFFARHSMRQFGPGEIPEADIETAVAIAQKSPSVCNRQGARVYCFSPATTALKWQPGNGGFGHLADKAFVVTADLTAFSTSSERNQAFVDGGLFAMSLVYGLHALGYGSCMLAWSKRPRDEQKMRTALGIPANEVIIMMIAAGHLPDTYVVAQSQRRPLSDVLHRIRADQDA